MIDPAPKRPIPLFARIASPARRRAFAAWACAACIIGALGAAHAALFAGASAAAQGLNLRGDRAAAAQPDKEVTVSATPSKTRVAPGEQFVVAVVLDHAPSWHTWPNVPVVPPELGGLQAIPTRIETPSKPAALSHVGPVQWPEPKQVEVRFGTSPVVIPSYAGRAVAYLPLIVAQDAAPGTVDLELVVSYQACDDRQCLFPERETHSVSFEVVAQGGAPDAPPADATLFEAFDIGVFGRMLSGEIDASRALVSFNAFGLEFRVDSAGVVGFALLLLLAALGGFLLNLTPCVLPVIPIKIMGLSQAAGNPARCFMLGLVMSAGVVSFWLAVGGLIAFVSGFSAISNLFQYPWFSVGVGVFIAAMGVGMLGLFTVRLPKAVYLVNPNHETPWGSFVFGVMTAVLSTPCTAPFMGSAAAWAATRPPLVTMVSFAAIGLGMAMPYLLLSANPKWVDRVPRTGPASELVKQVMGLLMLAVAAFFFGIGLSTLMADPMDPPSRVYWWFVAAFVIVAGGWLAWRTFRITKRTGRRAVFGAIGAALVAAAAFGAPMLTDKGPVNWVYYTPERFAQAIARGDVVALEFTAEWCLNCKALESTVLHRKDIAALLNSEGVTAMKIDLTGDNPPGRAKLRELDWVGIPLLAVFGPGLGGEGPLKYDAYTPEMVREAVARAR